MEGSNGSGGRPPVALVLAVGAAMLTVAGVPAATGFIDAPAPAPSQTPVPAETRDTVGLFEANEGQFADPVAFAAKGAGQQTFLTSGGVATVLTATQTSPDADPEDPMSLEPPEVQRYAFRTVFEGAREDVTPEGLAPVDARTHHFGGDAARDAALYETVQYDEVWEGIDLRWHHTDGDVLKYDVIAEAGASLDEVGLEVQGVDDVRVDADGDLVLATPLGDVVQPAPVSYEVTEEGAREPVDVGFTVDGDVVGFEAEDWSGENRLVVDPALEASSYIGGGYVDYVTDTALGPEGHIYEVAATLSSDYPAENGWDTSHNGRMDVAVSKLSPDGSSLEWSTFVGGPGDELGIAVDVGPQGDVWVKGYAYDGGFPTTDGAFQATKAGGIDGVLARLPATGDTLEAATFLGGSGDEPQGDVTVGDDGTPYVTSPTSSEDFPTVDAIQGTYGGGAQDMAVTALTRDLTTVEWSTFLGGSGNDEAERIAATQGTVYAHGHSTSTDYPTTEDAVQTENAGGADGVLSMVAADGSELEASTYLGGSDAEFARGVAVAPDGEVTVVGASDSDDYPTKDAIQATKGGQQDWTVTRLSPDASEIRWSTFLGGFTDDVAVDAATGHGGSVFVVGRSASNDFPLDEPLQEDREASPTNTVAAITASGHLAFSTFWGGANNEETFGGDGHGEVLVSTGRVQGQGYPTTDDAFQTSHPGNFAGFLMKASVFDAPDDAPRDLAAEPGPGAGEISLDWKPLESPDAETEAYHVYEVEDGSTSLVETVDGATTSLVVDGLGDDSEHTYVVSAENFKGEGPTGAPASARTFALPGTPQNLTASTAAVPTFDPANVGNDVEWEPPEATGGTALDAYNLYRSEAPEEGYALLATVSAAETTYTDRDVQPGQNYNYTVTAVNVVGESAPSNTDCSNPTPLVGPALCQQGLSLAPPGSV